MKMIWGNMHNANERHRICAPTGGAAPQSHNALHPTASPQGMYLESLLTAKTFPVHLKMTLTSPKPYLPPLSKARKGIMFQSSSVPVKPVKKISPDDNQAHLRDQGSQPYHFFQFSVAIHISAQGYASKYRSTAGAQVREELNRRIVRFLLSTLRTDLVSCPTFAQSSRGQMRFF